MPLIRRCYLAVMAAVFSLLFRCLQSPSKRIKDNDHSMLFD